ncbi:hypothetical protein BH11MYX3_BH11MYX3_29930 [soil metagenome]
MLVDTTPSYLNAMVWRGIALARLREMVHRLAILLVLLARMARADATEPGSWPTEPEPRLAAQLAACAGTAAAACIEAAATMKSQRVTSRFGYTPQSLGERAVTLFEQQCAAGTAASCLGHGKQLIKRGDTAGGTAKVEHACELGSGDACLYLAVRAKPAKAMPLLEQACKQTNAHACELVAVKIEKSEPARAAELHRTACAGDDAIGCVRSGEHSRAAGDKAGAFTDFADACDLLLGSHATGNDVAICDAAGTLATDDVRARDLFQRACDAGVALGCEHLGEAIARGRGGVRDWGAGLAMVADGCKRARDRTCKPLVELRKAPPAWECATEEACNRHCDEELWPACRRLAEISDPNNQHLYELACTGGDPSACTRGGDLSDDFAEALPYYRKGCALRDATSCRYVQLARALTSAGEAAVLRRACASDRGRCALYGLAIAKAQPKQAAAVWREACEAKIGVACRYLARTFDSYGSSGDAYGELAIVPSNVVGYGTCDCDGPRPSAKQAAKEAKDAEELNRRSERAQQLFEIGCHAGDQVSCDGVRGEHSGMKPELVVPLPAWE